MRRNLTRLERLEAAAKAGGMDQDWSVFGDRLHKSYLSHDVLTRGYDWAAVRSHDEFETSGETIIQALSITGEEMNFFFTQIERNKCGARVLGRRGHKTRVRWFYSLRSIGQMAQGNTNILAEVDPEVVANTLKQRKSSKANTPSESETPLTIPEAKRRLALTFGVPAGAIEIIIRG